MIGKVSKSRAIDGKEINQVSWASVVWEVALWFLMLCFLLGFNEKWLPDPTEDRVVTVD